MTKRERKLTNGKMAEILNLSESMVNSLIQKTEAAVQLLKERQAAIHPDLKTAEELYMSLKKPYEDLQATIDDEMQTLQVLIGYKRNTNDIKQVRVLRSTSNTNQKTRHYKRKFEWIAKCVEILEEEQKFLSPEALIKKICSKYPAYKLGLEQYKVGEKTGTQLTIKSIYTATDGEIRRKPKLAQYNEKIGLPSWMDPQLNSPKPQYLREVVFNGNVREMAVA